MGSLCRARARSRSWPLNQRAAFGPDRHWRIIERRGTPAVLHQVVPDPKGARLACLCVPLTSAVVLGSAQALADFDSDRLGAREIDLVRRRSGGGAVLVAPGEQVWLDVFVPSADELAEPDVGKSFHWLGEVFASSIAAVLGASASEGAISVRRGSAQRTPWSRTLCFAGLGAGEVTVAGRKVVGMSARRERSGAWIHSMALLNHHAQDLADFLAGTPDHRAAAREVLAGAGLPDALAGGGLPDAERLVGPLTEEVLGRLP